MTNNHIRKSCKKRFTLKWDTFIALMIHFRCDLYTLTMKQTCRILILYIDPNISQLHQHYLNHKLSIHLTHLYSFFFKVHEYSWELSKIVSLLSENFSKNKCWEELLAGSSGLFTRSSHFPIANTLVTFLSFSCI